MTKNKLPKPKKSNILPVKEHALSDDELKAQIAFLWLCETNCLLSDWNSKQLDKLVYCFKRMEKSIWRDIKKDTKFNYKTIDHPKIPPPKNLPLDFLKLKSIEVGNFERIYGYRTGHIFNIVFFDSKHKVCEM